MTAGKSDPAGPRPTASKPWVELNDPGNVMMTLGRRRVEWSVRMGVIYCLTMLYAVSKHVSQTTVFGTWPILANFYGTFAIASSVGGAVTGCIEMARGCTIGTLLAIATVEVTLAADNNLAQSTGLLSGILGALFVAVTITPILTKSEKQMLLDAVSKSTSTPSTQRFFFEMSPLIYTQATACRSRRRRGSCCARTPRASRARTRWSTSATV